MLTTCTNCGQQQDASSLRCIKCGQNLFSSNPYAAPTTMTAADSPFAPGPLGRSLANPGTRLVAQIIDGLLNLLVAAPGMIIAGVSAGGLEPEEEPELLFFLGLGLGMVGVLALNIYQWVIISRYGQSIGKRLMKIRIVKFDTFQPPGFVYGVLLRIWVNGVLSGLPCGIGLIYTIVDLCFIFRQDRRCVHDLIAQTVVLQA